MTEKYWKTTITVTVLSKGEDPPQFDDLAELHNLITDGPCSGDYNCASEEINRVTARRLLEEQSSDPDFLDMGAEWGGSEDDEDTGAGIADYVENVGETCAACGSLRDDDTVEIVSVEEVR